MQERRETQIPSLGRKDSLQKGMETHSSILARKISWTGELGRLQTMGPQSQTQLSTYAHMLSCVTPFTTCLLLLFSFHLLLHFPIFSSFCLRCPPKQTQRDHVQAEMVEVSDLNSNSDQGLTTLSSSQGRRGQRRGLSMPSFHGRGHGCPFRPQWEWKC